MSPYYPNITTFINLVNQRIKNIKKAENSTHVVLLRDYTYGGPISSQNRQKIAENRWGFLCVLKLEVEDGKKLIREATKQFKTGIRKTLVIRKSKQFLLSIYSVKCYMNNIIRQLQFIADGEDMLAAHTRHIIEQCEITEKI